MKVELLHHTPLGVCSTAVRTCWDSHDKSDSESIYSIGDKDLELIDRVGNKYKHGSTLEHIVFQFRIVGISRACLQELARHRMASLSVKSTRYTLKELKSEYEFPYRISMNRDDYGSIVVDSLTMARASKYIVITGNEKVDSASVAALENLRLNLVSGISNDIAKYSLPESYKTELVLTINARSLQNFMSLRTDKSALWEIRRLAMSMYDKLPDNCKILFDGCIHEEKK